MGGDLCLPSGPRLLEASGEGDEQPGEARVRTGHPAPTSPLPVSLRAEAQVLAILWGTPHTPSYAGGGAG